MTELDRFATTHILDDVFAERERQTEKWGVQHHPDGSGSESAQVRAQFYKTYNDCLPEGGHRWNTILLEEVYEALAETDPAPLREELLQVAAVCVAWVEDIDSRKEGK